MKDLFSNHAGQYAAFRPTYPKALYDFIIDQVKDRNSAWDCGCGNGQVANDLSPYFKEVHATDLSEKQIEKAIKVNNIFYHVSSAEQAPFKDSSFDLITVGQAVHWFNLPAFYKEVKRVAKPDAIIALWGYSLLSIEPSIDKHLLHFYTEVIGPYWDKERKLVDEQYKTIPFPFDEITAPQFEFSFQWSLEQFQGYLSTWSSVQKYIKQHGLNPVDAFINEISPLWQEDTKKVTFPLFLRIGKVNLHPA